MITAGHSLLKGRPAGAESSNFFGKHSGATGFSSPEPSIRVGGLCDSTPEEVKA